MVTTVDVQFLLVLTCSAKLCVDRFLAFPGAKHNQLNIDSHWQRCVTQDTLKCSMLQEPPDINACPSPII